MAKVIRKEDTLQISSPFFGKKMAHYMMDAGYSFTVHDNSSMRYELVNLEEGYKVLITGASITVDIWISPDNDHGGRFTNLFTAFMMPHGLANFAHLLAAYNVCPYNIYNIKNLQEV